MVFITGDCHGDWSRFSVEAFPEQKEMTRDDYVIVCGDFGIWNNTNSERWWLNWLEEKSFTILFVDGNHENFDRLYSGEFPVVDLLGGKAHKIRENVYHLMRGYVFNINGKKYFAFGGASSHDISDGILDEKDFDSYEEFHNTWRQWKKQRKSFRVNHKTWWKEEMPSNFEMEFGLNKLKHNNWDVDYIVTHCAPQEVVSFFSRGTYKPDILTQYFNDIALKTNFKYWFFGHYHDDNQYMSKYIMSYFNITRIE